MTSVICKADKSLLPGCLGFRGGDLIKYPLCGMNLGGTKRLRR